MLRAVCYLVALWPCLALPGASLTPDEVLGRIAKLGAAPTLDAMYEDGGEWRQVLSGIASGDRHWLRVAVELHPTSDAGPSRQLELATGEALEHHPGAVLEIAVPVIGIRSVCSGPDVDDKRYDSFELSTKAIERRKRMLRGVSGSGLVAVRNRCIQQLEASKAGIAKFYGVQR